MLRNPSRDVYEEDEGGPDALALHKAVASVPVSAQRDASPASTVMDDESDDDELDEQPGDSLGVSRGQGRDRGYSVAYMR